MKVIICVDKNNGILFNNRRLSRDKVIYDYILNMVKDNKLYCNEYSSSLFDSKENIIISNDFLDKATKEDYVFIENNKIPNQISELIVFRWNRLYPADTFFDENSIHLNNLKKISSKNFKGFSHNKITVDIFRR